MKKKKNSEADSKGYSWMDFISLKKNPFYRQLHKTLLDKLLKKKVLMDC